MVAQQTASAFPKHFDGKRCFNPNAPQARGLADVFRWKLSSRPERWPKFVSDVEVSVPPERVQAGELRVTPINHSTVLLQQGIDTPKNRLRELTSDDLFWP